MADYKINFDEIPWTSPKPGVRFKVHKDGSQQLRLVEFSDGFAENEWCSRGHKGYILGGTLEMTFPDKTVVYRTGDTLAIPSGEEHRHKGRILTEKVRFFVMEEI